MFHQHAAAESAALVQDKCTVTECPGPRRLLQLMTLTSDATVIGQQVLFPHISFMHGGDVDL